MNIATLTCPVCADKGYLIATRDDGRQAVECCDTCQSLLSDQSAALVAQADGIQCDPEYPCVLAGQ